MVHKKISDPGDLTLISKEIRTYVISSLAEAGSGHTGGSLGLADIFTSLYFSEIIHDPENPDWEERDRVILSAGHLAPLLYATLARAGYYSPEELLTLRKLGSRLQGHPGRDHLLPGIELSAGSLGQGLSVAVGRALAGKIDRRTWRVYSIHGDGELQEGSIWEAAMAASHHKLENLCAIIDRNNLQIDGPTEHVMALEPLADKWKSFGWNVVSCDGNQHDGITSAFAQARENKGQPTVIIARTIMGKGVKSIEGDYRWHGKAPSIMQSKEFIKELDS